MTPIGLWVLNPNWVSLKQCGTFNNKLLGLIYLKKRVHMLYYIALHFSPWVILVGILFK